MLRRVAARAGQSTAQVKLPKASTALLGASPALLVLALGRLLLLGGGGSALLPRVFQGARLQLLEHALIWRPILCRFRLITFPVSVRIAAGLNVVLTGAHTTFSMPSVWPLVLNTSALLRNLHTL